MFKRLSVVAVMLLTILQTSAEETNAIPSVFILGIGSFKKPDYQIVLREGVLIYSKRDGSETIECKITPTTEQWNRFRRELDRINVWQWQGDYVATNSLDGTGWKLLVGYPDRSLRKSGSNLYPDRSGKPSATPTRAFQDYLAAVRKLIGDREFDK